LKAIRALYPLEAEILNPRGATATSVEQRAGAI